MYLNRIFQQRAVNVLLKKIFTCSQKAWIHIQMKVKDLHLFPICLSPNSVLNVHDIPFRDICTIRECHRFCCSWKVQCHNIWNQHSRVMIEFFFYNSSGMAFHRKNIHRNRHLIFHWVFFLLFVSTLASPQHLGISVTFYQLTNVTSILTSTPYIPVYLKQKVPQSLLHLFHGSIFNWKGTMIVTYM